ncbi:lipid phosphate phosphatase 3 [Striga asiatica]|uniref:Lipid phosphate phosphatase 3 n=1 Tax=Striga asiatica TaxID=4170 RepID=A0A5A7QFI3_STRAF|nr:lipid phosphate phosphatase 3 [Striga asiatica]
MSPLLTSRAVVTSLRLRRRAFPRRAYSRSRLSSRCSTDHRHQTLPPLDKPSEPLALKSVDAIRLVTLSWTIFVGARPSAAEIAGCRAPPPAVEDDPKEDGGVIILP